MKIIKNKGKLWLIFILGILIGGIGAGIIYDKIPHSSQTIQEFLNQQYVNSPVYQYTDEVFTTIYDKYMIVFYRNPSKQIVSALFETQYTDLSKNYLSNSGSINFSDREISYLIKAQEIRNQSNKQMFVWGVLSDPEVNRIEASGRQAIIVELNDMRLWFSIIEIKNVLTNSEVLFFDTSGNLIKQIHY